MDAPAGSTEATTLFEWDGDAVVPTELSRGPWDPRACHGGPVAALLARSVEQLDDDGAWHLARLTVELVRPVPVRAPLSVVTEVERPGRKVSLVGVTVRTTDGVEVARARALRIRSAEVLLAGDHRPDAALLPPDAARRERPSWAMDHRAFHNAAVELRFLDGSFGESGPAEVWIRIVVPLLPGEEMTGVQRAVAVSDFGNGVSGELEAETTTFINPDLTVHLLRRPVGEWIALQARSHYGQMGAGMAESAVFDVEGRVGRAVQSLLLADR